jgi:tetratricopeptide (TPR) repeat protein
MPATASRPGRCCDRCGARLASYNRTTRCAACSSLRTLREPLVVPREFWDDGEMRDALATLHMGRVVYAYRMHPWHGQPLKQSVVGGWFGLTQTQVSRIENGRAPEEMSKLIRWARLLGVPGELLWFDLPGGNSAAPNAAPARTLPVIVGGRAILLPIDEHAARARGLDGLLAQCGERDAGRLECLPLAPRVPSLRNAKVHVLLAADRSELERLAAALDDARRYLDGSVVGLLREELGRCKAADGSLGPVRALPLTLGILGMIAEHVREVKPDVRGNLLSLGAESAEFAGWLYRDLKDPDSAVYWYDRAMEWAQEAHDPAMQGYVLLKKSQMAYDERDAHRVSTLAAAASHGPWQLPARVRVEAVAQEARGLAMLGEPFDAVEQKLDEAESLFTAADRPDDRQEFGTYFNEGALLTRRACCYVEGGKPARAAEVFGEAIEDNGLSRRDEGFFRALRALAYALSGEPDAAAQEGLTALDIATATNSERTTRELGRVVKVLDPWRTRPGPRQLQGALRR